MSETIVPSGCSTGTTAKLCIMATSDVHMHLTSHDHRTNSDSAHLGLARTATLMRKTREARDDALILTFDNGDILQGNAMADVMARPCNIADHPWPALVAALGYDAIGLGNHDFDYGLEAFETVFGAIGCPVLSANLPAFGPRCVAPFTVLERELVDDAGTAHTVRIGVLSVLPDQTRVWNFKHLGTLGDFSDAVASARTHLPQIKEHDTDLIIVLAHGGIAPPQDTDAAENFALSLAELPGIDAIVCGHTHLTFPGPDHADIPGVDVRHGTLHGVPAVMPGFGGHHLGVIDLALEKSETGWRVSSFASTLATVAPDTAECTEVLRVCAHAHATTRAAMTRKIGHSDTHLHSYFALLAPEPGQILAGQSMIATVSEACVGTRYEGIPIIAAACPSAMGGQGGPSNYFDLPPGAILQRHVAMLSPYRDEVWAVAVSGAEVLEWMERSAAIFAHLHTDTPDQPLTERYAPAFNFDTLIGITAVYDPTQPSRYTTAGTRTQSRSRRVQRAVWQGRQITPDQRFLVAATSYRSAGGGRFPGLGPDRISLRTRVTTAEAIATRLSQSVAPMPDVPAWRFASDLNVSAIMQTGPAARAHLADIARHKPQILSHSSDGFLRVRIAL